MKKSKTHFDLRIDFQEKYFKKLLPILQKEDDFRKTLFNLIKFSVCLFVLFATFSSLLPFLFNLFSGAWLNMSKVEFFAPLVMWFACLTVFSLYPRFQRVFQTNLKEKIMPHVCSCFGDFKWKSEINKTQQKLIKSSKVLDNNFLDIVCDDVIFGQYNDVKMEIYDCALHLKSDETKDISLFNGVIFKFDMNKNFLTKTIVRPKGADNSALNKFKKTTLEDVEFNSSFDVFCEDEVEARYLLTPTFMERLKRAQSVFKAEKVYCSFYKKYFFLALKTNKNSFNVCKLNKSLLDSKDMIFEMFEELCCAFDFIEHFKLEQRIGL